MNITYDLAMRLIGTPYIWGGEHPAHGLDCSGLVQLLLRSACMDPAGDQTAQDLYDRFSFGATNKPHASFGTLVFFGETVKEIRHVGFALDKTRMIEAAGGNYLNTTLERAIEVNAFVKISPIRKNHIALIHPKYPEGVFGE